MVHYTVAVTNTGGVDLTGVVVTDNIEGEGVVTLGVPGTPGSGVTIVSSGGGTPGDTTLSVNEVWTYTFDHTVTVAEYNAEQPINGGNLSFDNVATVVSTQTPTPVTSHASVVVETPPVVVDAISVTKDVTDVGGHGAAAHVNVAGEVVTYQIIVNNTGQNDPLTNVVVTDTGEAGVAGSLGVPGALGASVVSFSESGSGTHGNSTLDPGEIWTYTVQYTAKQTDLDTNGVDNDGLIDNLATATATDAVTNANVAGSDTASVPVDQLPSLTIAKDVTESSATAAGETLHYTITVHNTGNIDLSSVAITDALNGSGLSVPATPASGDTTDPGLLDVGETWVYSATHVVTQAEMDGGTALHNIATVTTNHTSAQSDDATTTISQQPSLTIAKDVTESSATAAGETLHYTITVHNTGNIDLSSVAISDALNGSGLSVPATPASGDASDVGVLDVGETWVYSATHVVTQAEMDGGTALHNIATVTTNHTSAQSDDATTTISQQPSLTIAKDVTESSATAAGETLHYTITVHNTGNIDLSSVAITDALNGSGLSVPATPASGDASDVGVLDVGETWVYSATHVVTQAEMDGGTALHNIATVTTNHTSAQSDDATTTIASTPSLTIAKDVTESSATAAGETLHYTITVHNTGNIDLSSVAITDALNGSGLSVPATPASGDASDVGVLDVGETWVYSATHVVTQAEMDGGTALHNIATVTTNHTSAQSDDATTTISQQPSLTIAKDVTESSATAAGETLHYTITVHNTGNIDLSSVAITDALNGSGAVGAGDAGERRRERRGRARCGRDLGLQRHPCGDAGGDGWRHGAAQHRHGDDQPHQRAV